MITKKMSGRQGKKAANRQRITGRLRYDKKTPNNASQIIKISRNNSVISLEGTAI